jgi:hypothetical protein
MENKQTAVEWLMDKLKFINKEAYAELYNESLEQAKQIEKEQITESHLQGLYSDIKMRGERQAEQYYNETYGKNLPS